jgi:hypothetical protein
MVVVQAKLYQREKDALKEAKCFAIVMVFKLL